MIGSAPAAFVAAVIYSLVIRSLLRRRPGAARPLGRVSVIVLAGLILEWVLLATAGAVRSRGVIGPVFYPAHLAVFLLSVPALANILVVTLDTEQRSFWFVVGLLCALLAVPLALTQYAVSEALYGIDGRGGPYAAEDPDLMHMP